MANKFMPKHSPTIGLEVHAELCTKTKMFCDCPNDPDEKHPNVNVCPICLGHPGVLPAINKKAVESVIKAGFAVNGEINKEFKFDRKNYFYPDLPKGYQISQYDMPIVKGGEVDISARLNESKIVKLNRVHLEEDAARLMHEPSPDLASGEQRLAGTLIDFNRSGVPLMELVTEPDMHSVEEAVAFTKELQLILRYLGISEADLERGQMRFDANISLSEVTSLGIKVEVKNLNSFAALEGAIKYEMERQAEFLESGKEIKQETRGWDDIKKITVSQRSKEEAHDYRYFPEPDLPPIKIEEFPEFNNLTATIPELPWQKRERWARLGIPAQDVEQYLGDYELAQFFDLAVTALKKPDLIKIASNFIANDLAGERKKSPDWPLPKPDYFATIVRRYQAGELASPQAKNSILSGVLTSIASADSLPELVTKIITENSKVVADFKAGKSAALQYLIGQGMKESKGAANPKILETLFKKSLK